VAVTHRHWLSPPKVVRWAELKAPVVQLPPVAVTEVMVTLAPLTVLVRVTVTVAPLVAVPLKDGVSAALMMLSVAMGALMREAVDGSWFLGAKVGRADLPQAARLARSTHPFT